MWVHLVVLHAMQYCACSSPNLAGAVDDWMVVLQQQCRCHAYPQKLLEPGLWDDRT